MATTELRPGIYRIVAVGRIEPDLLTRHGGKTRTRTGGSISLSDELDYLSLTSPFTGESSLVMMATSLSSDPPTSYLTYEALPRNPSKATGSRAFFLNSPGTNGTS
jgi:hypothetical protein